MKIGDKIQGKVTGVQAYGAFVELADGTIGLIHISEVKTGYVNNIRDNLKVGQDVLVQVMDLDEYTGKASLSLRTLEEEKQKIPRRHRFTSDRYKYGFTPLEENLPKWIEEAKEFLQTQKKEK